VGSMLYSLHPYTFYLRCMEVCKVSNKVLSVIFYAKAFETELNSIMEIFNTLFEGKYTLSAMVRIP